MKRSHFSPADPPSPFPRDFTPRLLVPPRGSALSQTGRREREREREREGETEKKKEILFSFSGRSRGASPAGSELPAGYAAN